MQGVSDAKASLKLKNGKCPSQQLGETLHTLQDFYSHSNWIELGNRSPYSTLIKPSLPLDNLTDVKTPTCSSCDDDCTGNILKTIITQKKLTSGYFSLQSPYKPKVAEIVAKAKKPHMIAERVTLPGWSPQAAKETAKVPLSLSDSTVGRQISNTSADIEDVVLDDQLCGKFPYEVMNQQTPVDSLSCWQMFTL
ncbi:hypothetical protein AOLI_G00055010 [Acnodon oligacanthus]